MARTTIIFGVVLVALGVGGYVASGGVSVTALIPAAFGVVLTMLGGIAVNQRYRPAAVSVAAAVALVGFLGSVRGLTGMVDLLSGAEVQRPAAVVSQSAMALATAIFLGLCVKAFTDARRARITRPDAP